MKFISALCLLASLSLPALGASPDLAKVRQNLVENYNYLIASQVNCEGHFQDGTYVCNASIPGHRHILGGWDSYIVPIMMDVPKMKYLDSNVFVTANTVLPLYGIQFEDRGLESQRKQIINSAMQSVDVYQRGQGFAFWPRTKPILPGQISGVLPLNLSPLFIASQTDFVKKLGESLHLDIFPKSGRFMEKNFNPGNPDLGITSELNIPNDSDDTAVGIVSNYRWARQEKDAPFAATYQNMARIFVKYTDNYVQRQNRHYQDFDSSCAKWYKGAEAQGTTAQLFKDRTFLSRCSLDDRREAWRYDAFADTYSGAFLSWQYDETKPVYADPEAGVALPGQNSVDCAINANVLYAISVTGMRADPSLRPTYEKTCNFMSSVMLDEQNNLRMGISGRKTEKTPVPVWTYCGLFYPVHMTFPYLLARAVAEGGACQDLKAPDQERFDFAMQMLTREIFREQDQVLPKKQAGEWFEKVDSSIAFSTAMGGMTLLNLRKAYGRKFSVSEQEWKNRIDLAMVSTLSHIERQSDPKHNVVVASAPAGAFFGGGFTDEAGVWISKPLATSVSMELMTQYVMTYDPAAKASNGVLTLTGSPQSIGASPATIDPNPNGPATNLAKTHPPLINLDAIAKKNFAITVDSGVAFDQHVKEAIIGIQLEDGQIYNGNFASPVERVAYYHVKLNGAAGVDMANGNVDRYELNMRFMGISSRGNELFYDEVALLPIQIVKAKDFSPQKDFSSQSVYLAYIETHAPIKQIGNDTFLDIDLTAKLLGAYHASNVSSLNLGEVKIGFTVTHGKFSVSAAADTALGVSRFGQTFSSSTRNSGVEARLNYHPTDNQTISIIARHGTRGEEQLCNEGNVCLPQSKFGLQYTYSLWKK